MQHHDGVLLGNNWKPFHCGKAFILKRAVLTMFASAFVAFFLLQALLVLATSITVSIWGLITLWAMGIWMTPVTGIAVTLGWLVCLKDGRIGGLILCIGVTLLHSAVLLLYIGGFSSLPWYAELLISIPLGVFIVPFLVCDLLLSVTNYFCFQMKEWKWLEQQVNVVVSYLNNMTEQTVNSR